MPFIIFVHGAMIGNGSFALSVTGAITRARCGSAKRGDMGVWESGALTLQEIGQLFGGLDYAAVAQRIRRTRSAYKESGEKLIKELLKV